MVSGGLGESGDQFHMHRLCKDTGENASIDATVTNAVFIAPLACEIIDISMENGSTIAAAAANHWTITIVNQTGDASLISDNFDTDSDNSGNGGRSFTADTITSLNDNGSGNNYLQNAILAKGDLIRITVTKAASATAIVYPMIVVRYRI